MGVKDRKLTYKIRILVKNRKFGSQVEILVKNKNIDQIQKFWSKIEIWVRK